MACLRNPMAAEKLEQPLDQAVAFDRYLQQGAGFNGRQIGFPAGNNQSGLIDRYEKKADGPDRPVGFINFDPTIADHGSVISGVGKAGAGGLHPCFER